jgi:colanic acid/amylovoran biosynthesis glycosyltransferase
MRIAIITGEFPKVSETFVLHHIDAMLALGHDVDIYAEHRPRGSDFASDDPLARRLEERTTYIDVPLLKTGKRAVTAPYKALSCWRVSKGLTLSTLSPSNFGRDAFNLSELHRLYALSRIRQQYDIVHAHFGMVGDRFRFVTQLWNAPLVVSFHGYDVSVWPRQRGRDCYRHLFDVASLAIANSEYTRQRVIDLGCPPGKIERLYPSWDMANFPYCDHPRQAGDPIRILTVARLAEVKGVGDAIAAVALARTTCAQIRYDIVGDGPLRAKIEALIQSLGVGDNVTLHGAQSRETVGRLMRAAHALIAPSVTTRFGAQEGLGVALLEAQASGLPVIATESGAFPEVIVNGTTGFLAPEHAPAELARWISYLCERPDVAAEMGRAARAHVERNFAPEQIEAQCIALYQCVITQFAKERGP